MAYFSIFLELSFVPSSSAASLAQKLDLLLGAGPALTQDVACSPAALADQPLQEPDDDYPQVAGHEDQKESTHNIGNDCC